MGARGRPPPLCLYEAPRGRGSRHCRRRRARDSALALKGPRHRTAQQDRRGGAHSSGTVTAPSPAPTAAMREIVHIQAGQCGNQIGTKVSRGVRGLPPLLLREPRLRGALLDIKGVGKRLKPTFYTFYLKYLPSAPRGEAEQPPPGGGMAGRAGAVGHARNPAAARPPPPALSLPSCSFSSPSFGK